MAWAYNTQEGTPNNGSMIASIALAVTALSLVALCLRLYVRTRIAKAVGLDDWLIIAGWIGACGYASAIVVQTKWGLGLTSLNDMPDKNVVNFGFTQYVGAPFYVLGIWGFKTSLLVSYVRLVPGTYRLVPISLAVIVTLAHIAFLLVFLLLCIPVRKQWIPTTPGHCGQAVPFYITFSSLTIIFDVITLVLPFPVLIKLQMKRRRKIALLCLFALGIFVTIVQIIRIQTIASLVNYLDSAEAIKWSIVETNVGIIIACVPTLAPLVTYFAEKTRSGGSSNTPVRPGGDGGFALQSWRVTKNGMRPLGSGVDRENEGEKSTENILQGPVASVSEASEASDGARSHEQAASSARRHVD
ncbi:uncharacterized protein TrAFT101_003129 [Trichoderma asperellum]|uniref:Rhodopsin domain-containing protein n=1 Tax=Trichoderma asperellum (strain ATCC 204424 / CBS 433.97 / NBRC 101777) TaxID=1042311 RepID=A0A2T3ZID9_TRIA4|nr:hypothetical protein M441DRAFT_66325 [Trichoderma asperellum CBS 433.97]PTB44579.1 hypothetical protein M441DRAFT_66325 [Trichoderma asperellum CBS 433.97]UKZ87321.1 hypothetical protein TrAFT101_003129 [Trichoderma asperellum]